MSGTTNTVRDRRSERHETAKGEIVAAAWELAREEGLAGLSLRELGRRVGMQAQSLYSYFPSKDAIYDAMFADGYRQYFAERAALEAETEGLDARATLKSGAHWFFAFCTADPTRYQLLFQRTIPGFEPSEDSYRLAVAALDALRDALAACGIDEPGAVDLWTALLAGMTDQQISNDPGGDRWERQLDRAVDMFFDHLTKGSSR